MDNKRILLVEDNELMQKLYVDLLKNEGYLTEFASDGKTAYEKMTQGDWDLVLLDIVLPDMTGVDIIKRLQNNQPLKPNKKIVFLTNLDTGKEIDEIKKLGFDHLTKSDLDPSQFVDKVKSLI